MAGLLEWDLDQSLVMPTEDITLDAIQIVGKVINGGSVPPEKLQAAIAMLDAYARLRPLSRASGSGHE